MTSRDAFIPEVDGIRFLAILAVLVFHSVIDLNVLRGTMSPTWSEGHGFVLHFIGMGWFGVQIFFVLSGFIVALPFARHALQGVPKPDVGRYYLRRVTRIEPPYIVALTVTYLFAADRWNMLPHFLAGLIYSHQYIFGAGSPLFFVAWSLEVEVFFYIFAPWLSRVYAIKANRSRWAFQLLLMGSLNYIAVYKLSLVVRSRTTILEMMPYFLAGMLLADWYASGLLRRSANAAWDFAIAMSVLGLTKVISASAEQVWTYYWALPFLTIVLFVGIFKGRVANWFLRRRLITLIGGMCYTLYLWHSFMLFHSPYWLKAHVIGLPYATGVAVCCLLVVPALIAACIPIYLFVEKPFMNGAGSLYIEERLRSIVGFARPRKPIGSAA